MKLKECCDFIDYRGKTPEKSDFGYRFITAKNVGIDGFHDEPMEFIPKENYENVMVRGIPEEGNILFTTEAPMGHVGMIPHFEEPFAVGQRLIVIQPNKELLVPKYLMYLLRSRKFQDKVTGRSSGSTVTGIRSKELIEISISFPDIEIQKIVSDILDLLEEIIKNRVKELRLLDDLIKARFVEMFGDPVTNDMNWDMDTLLGILEAGRTITYGIVQTGEDVDEGVPVFRPIDIAGGHVPKREELKRTLPEISDKYKRTLLKGNELLITVRGSVGETFQVDEGFDGCNVGRNIVPLVTDKNRVNQRFLQELFAQKPIKNWLKAITKGIALQGLNMSEFKEMPVIIPNMRLQEDYVEFVKQVDKSKVVVQKALNETRLLFDSLMQEYFG